MREKSRHVKVIELSDPKGSFVGQDPSIIGPCCHGDDETTVTVQLCQVVDEWIEIMKAEGAPVPPPTVGRGLVERILAEVQGGRADRRP